MAATILGGSVAMFGSSMLPLGARDALAIGIVPHATLEEKAAERLVPRLQAELNRIAPGKVTIVTHSDIDAQLASSSNFKEATAAAVLVAAERNHATWSPNATSVTRLGAIADSSNSGFGISAQFDVVVDHGEVSRVIFPYASAGRNYGAGGAPIDPHNPTTFVRVAGHESGHAASSLLGMDDLSIGSVAASAYQESTADTFSLYEIHRLHQGDAAQQAADIEAAAHTSDGRILKMIDVRCMTSSQFGLNPGENSVGHYTTPALDVAVKVMQTPSLAARIDAMDVYQTASLAHFTAARYGASSASHLDGAVPADGVDMQDPNRSAAGEDIMLLRAVGRHAHLSIHEKDALGADGATPLFDSASRFAARGRAALDHIEPSASPPSGPRVVSLADDLAPQELVRLVDDAERFGAMSREIREVNGPLSPSSLAALQDFSSRITDLLPVDGGIQQSIRAKTSPAAFSHDQEKALDDLDDAIGVAATAALNSGHILTLEDRMIGIGLHAQIQARHHAQESSSEQQAGPVHSVEEDTPAIQMPSAETIQAGIDAFRQRFAIHQAAQQGIEQFRAQYHRDEAARVAEQAQQQQREAAAAMATGQREPAPVRARSRDYGPSM